MLARGEPVLEGKSSERLTGMNWNFEVADHLSVFAEPKRSSAEHSRACRPFKRITRPLDVVLENEVQSMIQCCVSGVLFLEKSRIQQKDWMRVIGQEGTGAFGD